MAIKVAIEGYDELEQIGVGGMAAVYRARKVSIDKIVAIKLLFPYLATDESYIERFQREAKAAASIQHENIVNIIDFGESDGSFYIVMEYYDGRTLEQLMKERPGLPPEISIRILLEVAYGLEAAHALDIVHRDVKPANIIVTNTGAIKIADFGLARKTDSATMITQHGKVVGTPAYMSPEQAAGRPIGPASDIFSFGVVAYELLGRRKPFEGQSYSDVLEKIQTFDPTDVGMVNPLISPELEAVVARCLQKDESERYRSAAALVIDLEAAMEKSQIARDRRQLAAYVKDPERYDAAFAEKTITECLSRGAFFMQKGRSHLDDAVLEYRRVLFLDPSHERALANLDKLHGQKDDGERTVTMDIVTPVTAAAAMAGSARGARATPRTASRRKPAWIAGIAAALVLMAGGTFWFSRSHTTTGEPQQTAALKTHSVAPPLQGQALVPPHDSTAVATKPSGADNPATKPTMVASSSDNGLTPLTENTPAGPAPEKHVSATRQVTPPPVAGAPKHDTATKPARTVIVEQGSLSVYFLGGVGDVWIDGKLFPHQPPFERAPLAAGEHRVSCRMSEDTQSKEITVTIRPEKETVIEYEVGAEPVVSDE
ncbi:MAG TPA: protein kinase [Candidatus Krumholzibacteria bacterium]|nr:protein kinase [Candidatus Krumholzibacteria bacterium]